MSLSISSATCVPLAAAIKAYNEVSEQLNYVRDPQGIPGSDLILNPSFYYTIFDSPVKEGVMPLAGRVVNRRLRDQLFRWQRGAIQVLRDSYDDNVRGLQVKKILNEALQRVDEFEKEFSLKSTRVSIAPTLHRVDPSDGSSRQESPSHTGWGDQTQPLYIEPATQADAAAAVTTRPVIAL